MILKDSFRIAVLLALLGLMMAGPVVAQVPPGKDKPQVSWQLRLEPAKGQDGGITHNLVLELSIPPGLHAFRQEEFLFFEQTGSAQPAGELGASLWSEPDTVILDLPAYSGTIQARLPLGLAGTGPRDLGIRFGWQVCNDTGLCFKPEVRQVTVRLDPESVLVSEVPTGAVDTAPAPVPEPGTPDKGNDPIPLLLVLLFAFLGGLILNVMPCVLPVLSIKVLSLMEQGGAPEVRNNRLKTLAGFAGIFAGIMGLGVIVLSLRATGQAAGWGFQFQNPHFALVLNLVVFALGLSLAGLWQLQVAMGPRAVSKGPKKQYGRAFLDGLLMVALATPCSAPFLGTAMGFALSAPAGITLGVFAALALGLGLPFFVLGWFPRLRGLLPKPGPWMDTVKVLMAFLLFGTSVWLFGISLTMISIPAALSWLGLAVVLALCLWLWGQAQMVSGKKALVFKLLAAVLLVTATVLLYPFDTGRASAGEASGEEQRGGVVWKKFSAEAVDAALGAGKPVFVDFGASWCITCTWVEKGVLSDPKALAPLAEQGTLFLRGDFTLEDPELLGWMQKAGRAGVPFYQVIAPGGQSLVLPELPGPSDLEAAALWLKSRGRP